MRAWRSGCRRSMEKGEEGGAFKLERVGHSERLEGFNGEQRRLEGDIAELGEEYKDHEGVLEVKRMERESGEKMKFEAVSGA